MGSDRGGRIILDITVPDVSTMKSLLNYMYTDRVAMASARSRHRHGLAMLARKLGVKGLSYFLIRLLAPIRSDLRLHLRPTCQKSSPVKHISMMYTSTVDIWRLKMDVGHALSVHIRLF